MGGTGYVNRQFLSPSCAWHIFLVAFPDAQAAMKSNAQFIHQYHSDDDPLIPVEEARVVAQALAGDNFCYEEVRAR